MSVATRSSRQAVSAQTTQTNRLSLANAIKTGRKLPSRIILHGQGGIGKTSFAAHAPNPIFLLSKGETGLHTLIDNNQLPEVSNLELSDWSNVIPMIEELATTQHDYKTLVLDTIDGFEKMCNQHVCMTAFQNDWGEKGFMGYRRGSNFVASGPWRELLMAIDTLREAKRMGVIMLAHTTQGTFNNPTGSDYSRYVPDMYKDVWQLTFGWADIVLFGYPVIVATKDRGDKKAKGKGGDIRVMATEWDASADAKHRHGLPAEIEMGNSGKEAWDNFIAALRTGKDGGNHAQ